MKPLLITLALTLGACATGPTMTVSEVVAIAEKDLNFTAYEIRLAPVEEVRAICSGSTINAKWAVGCTSAEISLVSDGLVGCERAELLFHELLHQYQFQEYARTGINNLKELPAYLYGAKMAQKHCLSN